MRPGFNSRQGSSLFFLFLFFFQIPRHFFFSLLVSFRLPGLYFCGSVDALLLMPLFYHIVRIIVLSSAASLYLTPLLLSYPTQLFACFCSFWFSFSCRVFFAPSCKFRFVQSRSFCSMLGFLRLLSLFFSGAASGISFRVPIRSDGMVFRPLLKILRWDGMEIVCTWRDGMGW